MHSYNTVFYLPHCIYIIYILHMYMKQKNMMNWFYLSVLPDRDLMSMEERYSRGHMNSEYTVDGMYFLKGFLSIFL